MHFCNPTERNEQGQKQCNVCKQWKDENEFSKNRCSKDGLQSACKVCQREQIRKSKEKYRTIPYYTAQALIRDEQGQKQCSKCKQWKSESEFGKKANSADGLSNICKFCQHDYDMARSEQRKEKYRQIREQERERNRKYDSEGRLLKQCSKYKQYKVLNEDNFRKNKRNIDGYEGICRQCIHEYNMQREARLSSEEKEVRNRKNIEYMRKYREENREVINAKKRKENLTQMQILSHTISSAIYRVLRNIKSDRHWEDLVGYSIQELKEYLELQFDENMNWENMGDYWEIDHIVPLNLFHYNTEQDEQFKICWSLANLRPLEKIANKSRPKDGSDIPQEIRDKILGQNLKYGIMSIENKEKL